MHRAKKVVFFLVTESRYKRYFLEKFDFFFCLSRPVSHCILTNPFRESTDLRENLSFNAA